MKPCEITMQAFGAYLENTAVDFSLLNGATLFIISGATGSGKTTILDAMSFALFGKSTGKQREFKEMRCDKAPFELATKVSFDFIVGDKRFKFIRTRTPKKVKRHSGDIENDFTETAEAYECGKEIRLIAGGGSRVSQKAEEILGFNHEQFSQIIVLPQGEFKKLLLANTADKEKILQALFDVSRFGRLAKKIESNVKQLYSELKSDEERRNGLLEGTDFDCTEDLRLNIERTSEILKRLCTETEAKKQELEKAGNKYELLCRAFELTADIEKSKAELKNKNQLIVECCSEIKELDPGGEGIASLRSKENELLNKQAEIKEKLDNLENLKKALENKISAEKAEKQNREENDKNSALREELKLRVENGKRVINEREEIISKVPSLKAEIESYSSLKEKTEAFNQKTNQLIIERKRLDDKKIVEQAASDALSDIEKRLSENSAYLLASNLKENTPCPVCGSIHHPQPAAAHNSGYTARRLEIQKELFRKCAEERTGAEAKCAEISAQISMLESDISALCTKLDFSAEKLSFLEQISAEIAGQLKMAQKYEAEQVKLKNAVREFEERIDQCGQNEIRLARLYAEIRAERAEAETEYERLGKASEHADRSSAEAEYNRLENEKNKLAYQIKRYDLLLISSAQHKASVAQIEKQINELKAKLTAERIRLFGVDRQVAEEEFSSLIETAENERKQAEELYNEYSKMYISQSTKSDGEKSTLSKIEAIERSNREKNSKYELTRRLSDMLSGKINPKIQLQTFALGIMFDDVIAAANMYFEELSRGQYNLVRDSGKLSGNGYKGLELLVLDLYVGDTRPVNTLSGGELFLASMSLAFGLSQVVEGYAGGIHLDTIFIDEGFGSLDDETLECAMKAFDHIRKSGRTVGIISHVAGLNERIGARIEVIKSGEKGSRVKIFDC